MPLSWWVLVLGSGLVLLGRAQPQLATNLPGGNRWWMSWAWLTLAELPIAYGPAFGWFIRDHPTDWLLPSLWLLLACLCAVTGHFVAISARAIVIRSRLAVRDESAQEALSAVTSGSIDLPSNLSPAVARYVREVKVVDVDGIMKRHDDACLRQLAAQD